MNTEQPTQLTAQESALQRAKSSAEKKFELVIAETIEVVNQCKSIVISDSTTLSMANQLLSKANNGLKDAEEKRKAFNKPYADQISFVNDLVKSKITNPLAEAVEHGKKLLRDWNEKELQKANELKSEDTKRFTFLKTCEANIQKQAILCDTEEKCDKLIMTIQAQWPSDDKFGKYVQEAIATKNNFISLLNTKKIALKGSLNNDVQVVTESIEQINETIAAQSELVESVAEKQSFIQENIVPETSAVRRSWKYEVVDESKLPREFLSIDPKKVKAYMDANKDKFEESGTIKCGVKFFRDAAPQIK